MATASTAAVTRFVRPLQTSDTRSAKITVLGIYKEFQRLTSESWWDFQLTDIPLPVLREAIKKEFTKNGHLKDLRVIDRKVGEARAHLVKKLVLKLKINFFVFRLAFGTITIIKST